MMKKRLAFIVVLMILTVRASAQQFLGMEGLVHVPTADMDTVGIARIGAHYLPKRLMPDKMLCDNEKFNSLTNYLSITPFKWIEVGYGYTLWKMHKNVDVTRETGFYSKDRYFSVKLQLLKEDKWWPSVVVGGNDVWGSSDNGKSGSNFRRNSFMALSKHHAFNSNVLGAHVAYRRWKLPSNGKWQGLVGGVTFSPSVYRPLRTMVEWDGNEVNIGADCHLFKYLLVQCALIDFKDVSGGLCLCIPLL